MKFIDVIRHTFTNIDSGSEQSIRDVWKGEPEDQRELMEEWTGSTTFELLKPLPPPGYRWINGRLTRDQTTTRPDHIFPETWPSISKRQKGIEIQKGEEERKEKTVARNENVYLQGRFFVPEAELEEYNSVIQLELTHSQNLPRPPAMPVVYFEHTQGNMMLQATNGDYQLAGGNPQPSPIKNAQTHNERIQAIGSTSIDGYMMVHAPIKFETAMGIPAAKAAIQK